jgi:pimeloyl-ACP methyl ester carboxylesterase
MQILYLHGFASSPDSTKALFLRQRLTAEGYEFTIPDLNQPSFEFLDIHRVIATAAEALESIPGTSPIAIIGSSLGAFCALQLLARRSNAAIRVSKLVLLAPALAASHNKQLTEEVIKAWKTAGHISVYHSGSKSNRDVPYSFFEGFNSLGEATPSSAQTMIFHGVNDEIIELKHSKEFTLKAPHAALVELKSDHQLLSHLNEITDGISTFLSDHHD